MSSDIVAALIGAISAIVVALIAARNEKKKSRPKPGETAQPRPLLIFAATGALLLSITVLAVALFLQTLPRLGYTSVSVIICAGSPNPADYGGGNCYDAPQRNTSGVAAAEHAVPVDVPKGSSIIGAWYTLEDRIDQLALFDLINVSAGLDQTKQLSLSLRAKSGVQSFMRIRLHAVYTR